jgi:hypothetical protein
MPWEVVFEKASLAVFSIALLFLLWQQTKEMADLRDVLKDMINALSITITELTGCTKELKDRQKDMNLALDNEIGPTLRDLLPILRRLQELME